MLSNITLLHNFWSPIPQIRLDLGKLLTTSYEQTLNHSLTDSQTINDWNTLCFVVVADGRSHIMRFGNLQTWMYSHTLPIHTTSCCPWRWTAPRKFSREICLISAEYFSFWSLWTQAIFMRWQRMFLFFHFTQNFRQMFKDTSLRQTECLPTNWPIK